MSKKMSKKIKCRVPTDKDRDWEKGRFKAGNLVSLGNKGGGRKSAYQEHLRAEILAKAFFEEVDIDTADELIERVTRQYEEKRRGKRGKTTLFEVMIAKGLLGNDKILVALSKKVFPDRIIDETPPQDSPAKKLIDAIMGRKEETEDED